MLIKMGMPTIYRNAEGGGSGGDAGGDKGGDKGGTGGEGSKATSGTPNLPWLPNATTEEIAFVQSKGWDKSDLPPVDQVIRSYHNLQKTFGADKAGNTVVLPGEKADEATLNNFYNRLGRPEKADGYGIKEFAGLNETQVKGLSEVAHKAGLTTKQLTALKEWNDNVGKEMQAGLENDAKIEFAKQESALKLEWGAAYEKNLGTGKEAVAKLGLSKDQVDAMQMALGYDGVLKLMAQVGAGLGEGQFVTGDKGRAGGDRSNVMTPEQAKTELKRLQSDKEFQDAWMNAQHPRHKEMVEKKSQLSKWSLGQN